MDETERADVEAAIKEVREAIEADDSGRMESALERLNTTVHTLSQAMYANASEPGDGGAAADGGAPADGNGAEPAAEPDADVVEGEFREA